MPFIVVEIPQQMPPSAWYAKDDSEFIVAAAQAVDFDYEEYTPERALATFGDVDEIPSKLAQALEAEGKAIEISSGDGSNQEWFKPSEAPSEFEAAKEALFDDLYAGLILTEEEARRFISDDNDIYRGHQFIEAQIQVKKLLAEVYGDE